MNNDFNIPIDLDEDVEYEGNTEQEQILNKELLKTTLELNMYQIQALEFLFHRSFLQNPY